MPRSSQGTYETPTTRKNADGTEVQGFSCEELATSDAPEITHHGGWRAYLRARD